MSAYEIAWRCGHQTSVNISGTNVRGERERKAGSLARLACPACRKAAPAPASDPALPALTGPAWEVARAQERRAAAIQWITEAVAKSDPALVPQVAVVITRAAARETSAAAWAGAPDPRYVITACMDEKDNAVMQMLQFLAGDAS